MLKKMILMSLLTLQCACASEEIGDLYCNYRLLDKRKESYVGRIIELIPIRSEKIVEDLDFLYADQDKNFQPRNFTKNDFIKLCEDEKEHEKAIMGLESQAADSPHFFSQDCFDIFCQFQLDPVKQQAIYILLEEVNDELSKYVEVEKTKLALKTPPLSEDNISLSSVSIVSSSSIEDRSTPEKRKRNVSQSSMLPNKKTIIT